MCVRERVSVDSLHMVAVCLYVNTNFIKLKQRGRTPSGPKLILCDHKDEDKTGADERRCRIQGFIHIQSRRILAPLHTVHGDMFDPFYPLSFACNSNDQLVSVLHFII